MSGQGKEERPGGWVDGIGWVALYGTLRPGDKDVAAWPVDPGVIGTEFDRLVLVTSWADGTVPAPEPPAPDPVDLPEWFLSDAAHVLGEFVGQDFTTDLIDALRPHLRRLAAPAPDPLAVVRGSDEWKVWRETAAAWDAIPADEPITDEQVAVMVAATTARHALFDLFVAAVEPSTDGAGT